MVDLVAFQCFQISYDIHVSQSNDEASICAWNRMHQVAKQCAESVRSQLSPLTT